MTLVHPVTVSFQCPDTGFYPKGCHPSAYFFVIPVRDTGISFRNFIV
ncbi:hypothetical protein H9I48_04945 [Wolbachia pipientis]|nr:hypothetical protein [Wolbachia pipientis]MBC6686547.1 hypothetical protein [Wolbachia pipientis]